MSIDDCSHAYFEVHTSFDPLEVLQSLLKDIPGLSGGV